MCGLINDNHHSFAFPSAITVILNFVILVRLLFFIMFLPTYISQVAYCFTPAVDKGSCMIYILAFVLTTFRSSPF